MRTGRTESSSSSSGNRRVRRTRVALAGAGGRRIRSTDHLREQPMSQVPPPGYPPQGYPPQGPPPGYPPQSGGYSVAPEPKRSNGWAISSLICGILGCIPLITGILAVLLGAVGLAKTKNPRVGGK